MLITLSDSYFIFRRYSRIHFEFRPCVWTELMRERIGLWYQILSLVFLKEDLKYVLIWSFGFVHINASHWCLMLWILGLSENFGTAVVRAWFTWIASTCFCALNIPWNSCVNTAQINALNNFLVLHMMMLIKLLRQEGFLELTFFHGGNLAFIPLFTLSCILCFVLSFQLRIVIFVCWPVVFCLFCYLGIKAAHNLFGVPLFIWTIWELFVAFELWDPIIIDLKVFEKFPF